MAGALTNIGYHISEKELIRGKNVGIFDPGAFARGCWEPATPGRGVAWILGLTIVGVMAFMNGIDILVPKTKKHNDIIVFRMMMFAMMLLM